MRALSHDWERAGSSAKPGEQFLVESALLGLFGGVIGIALGYGMSWGATWIVPDFSPPHVPVWSVVLGFFFSASVGVVFGLYPAAKAARLDPIDAPAGPGRLPVPRRVWKSLLLRSERNPTAGLRSLQELAFSVGVQPPYGMRMRLLAVATVVAIWATPACYDPCMAPVAAVCDDGMREIPTSVCDAIGDACVEGPKDCRGAPIHCARVCDEGEVDVYRESECPAEGCREVELGGETFLCADQISDAGPTSDGG